MSQGLPEGIAEEQKRVVALLEEYRALGPTGAFGYTLIRATLFRSFDACASADPVEMLRALDELRGCS